MDNVLKTEEALFQDNEELARKYLTFHLANQLYGIPVADVIQIIGVQPITEIPEFPSYAKGVINLRGIITPMIDIRLRFGLSERAYDEKTCIIVTQIGMTGIGFIVDAVEEVTDFDDKNISTPPQISNQQTAPYLLGLAKQDEKIVLLINTKKMLTEHALETMTHLAPSAL